MTIEGTWELTIATPVGKQYATVQLAGDGDSLRGKATANEEEMPLENLVVDGNRLAWTVSMSKPLRLRVAFSVVVDGDEMTGHSKAGHFPRSTVTGQWAPR
jgi:hypothetical protein